MAKPKSEAILVVGMHRSGTSVLSRVFSLLGYGLSTSQIGIDHTNESGHWESRRLARLNDDILSFFGQDWESAAPIIWNDVPQKAFGEWVKQTADLICDDFGEGRSLIIKDPRICRLIPVYDEAIAKLDLTAKYVIPIRNPLDVKASLQTRNNMSEAHAMMLWYRYVVDALTHTEGLNRAFLATDRLIEAPELTVKELIRQLDLNTPFSLSAVAPDIGKLVNPEQLHHSASGEALRLHPCAGQHLSTLYQSMRVLAAQPDSKEALKRINQAVSDFRTAAPMVGSLVEELGENRHEALRLGKVLKETEKTLGETIDLAKCRKVQVEDIESEYEETLTRLRLRLGQSETALLPLKRRLEQTEATLAKTLSELESERDKLDKAQKSASIESKTLRKTLRSKDRELKRLHQTLVNTRQDLWASNDRLMLANEYLNAMGSSTSWKITRPIRGLKRLLSGQPMRQLPMNTRVPTPSHKRKSEGPEKVSSDIKSEAAEDISPDFDEAYYLNSNGLKEKNSWEHFKKIGWKQGLDPSATFSTNGYLAANPEVRDGSVDPLSHMRDKFPGYFSLRRNRPRLPGEPRLAVVSAMSGGYDTIRDPAVITPNTDYILFTDQAVSESTMWQTRAFEYIGADEARTARHVKTHPHIWFSDYDWVIWVDSNLRLVSDARELLVNAEPYDMLAWHHPIRSTWLKEAEACMKRKKDEADIIGKQVSDYKAQGVTAKGLWETGVLAFNMKRADKVAEIANGWWAEILKHSRRDQIALPKVLSDTDAKIGAFTPKGICLRTDHRFEFYKHNKKGES